MSYRISCCFLTCKIGEACKGPCKRITDDGKCSRLDNTVSWVCWLWGWTLSALTLQCIATPSIPNLIILLLIVQSAIYMFKLFDYLFALFAARVIVLPFFSFVSIIAIIMCYTT